MILKIYISDNQYGGQDVSIPALGIDLKGVTSVEIIDTREKDEDE